MKLRSYLCVFLLALSLNVAKANAIPMSEREALQAFYDALGGPAWDSELDGDLTNDWDFSGEVSSNWYGVIVVGGHVTKIEISSFGNENNVIGYIPTEISNLPFLEVLSVSYADLSGSTIPSSLGQLSALKNLTLTESSLDGTIPDSFSGLTSIIGIRAYGNNFSGPLPAVIGSMTTLKYLDLAYNGFTSIPDEICNLNHLRILDLSNNKISSSIPANIGNMDSLRTLILEENIDNFGNFGVSGAIPESIGNLAELKVLRLGTNKLSDTLPASIGQMDKLRWFLLRKNDLVGHIPKELGDLDRIERIDLSENKLSGQIPAELGNLPMLITLDLSTNSLTGSIPSEFANIPTIEYLWFTANSLSGQIPAALTTSSTLKVLDIGDCQMSGAIPDFSSSNLSRLGIYGNQFQFGDFETQFNAYKTNISSFYYFDQAKVNEEVIQNLAVGSSISMVTDCSGGSNSYQWFLNGNLIAGATSSTLNLSNLQTADAGVYHCDVTSGIVTDLIISRNTFTLQVGAVLAPSGPGGVVDNNVLWVRGNEGITKVGQYVLEWKDQSSAGNDAQQQNFQNQPILDGQMLNYYPCVYFDGNKKFLTISNNLMGANNLSTSVFAVGTNEAGGDSRHAMVFGQGNSSWSGGGFGLCGQENTGTFGFWVSDWDSHAVLSPLEKNKLTLLEGKYDGSSIDYYKNGHHEGAAAFVDEIGDAGTTHLGGDATNNNHKGYISEAIVYDTGLTQGERDRVNSYLAIKYGLTADVVGLSGHYLSSDGATIYSDNLGVFWYHTLGLGRDDGSVLLHKQTHLESDSIRMYLGSLAVSNFDNNSDAEFAANKQFVVMGDNNKAMHNTSAEVNNKPQGVFRLVDRVWKVQNTDFAGTFSVDILLDPCVFMESTNPNDLRLIVDSDSDFLDGQIFDNTNGISFSVSGGYVTISGISNSQIPSNSIRFFTVGSAIEPNFQHFYNQFFCDNSASVVVNGTIYDQSNPTGIQNISTASGCDSVVVVNLTFGGSIETNISQTLCAGQSMDVNGTTYNQANPTGTEATTNFLGCDSIINVSLTFLPEIQTELTQTLCSGQSVTVNGTVYDVNNPTGTETMTAVSGCDSIININLTFQNNVQTELAQTLCSGQSMTVNGTVYDVNNPTGTETMTAVSGCDSIVNINLAFQNSVQTELTQTLCTGESITVNGVVYDAANPSGTETTTTVSGCDSIITVNLSFAEPTQTVQNQTLCFGESITVNGTIYNEANPTGTEVLSTVFGCDSTVTIDLSFQSAAQTEITQTLCFGESLIVNENEYNAANPSGTETTTTISGCDSIITVNLSFEEEIQTVQNLTLCFGANLVVNGTTFDESNPSGTETMTAASGCDSTVVIDLSFETEIQTTLNQTLCFGESLVVNSVSYDADNPSGTETMIAASGCDSTILVNLAFEQEAVTTINQTLCLGQSMTINGTVYSAANPSGTEHATTVSGCDSTIHVDLSFAEAILVNWVDTLCAGESVTINGQIYNVEHSSGKDTLTSVSGCDSILLIDLLFGEPAYVDLSPVLCFGEAMAINGTEYNESHPSGTETLETWLGCDSVVAINLVFSDYVESYYADTICQGESIVLNGREYNGGHFMDVDTLTSVAGCDSIVHVSIAFYDDSLVAVNDFAAIQVELGGSINVLDNDTLSAAWAVSVISNNHPDWVTFSEDGLLTFLLNRADDGDVLEMTYEVCDLTCPNICKEAKVIVNYIGVQVVNEPEVFVSDILTLNGDGKNDRLVFKGLNANEGIWIYNRWGDVVFRQAPYGNDWDGQSQSGEDLPNGTYYYILNVNQAQGLIVKGDVLLVR